MFILMHRMQGWVQDMLFGMIIVDTASCFVALGAGWCFVKYNRWSRRRELAGIFVDAIDGDSDED